MAAIRLIGAALAQEVHEVIWLLAGDRHQRAEIHQEAAVAVEHDDAPVVPGQRQAERAGRGLTHRADRVIGKRVIGRDAERFLPKV